MKVVLGGIFTVVVIAGIAILAAYFSFSNKEIDLRSQSVAQNSKIEIVYDQMAKIISGKAQVTTEYKNGFKEIFVSIMEGRYSKGDGALLKLVQEQNPTFDASMYKDLMQSIEVERLNFSREQEVMVDIVRTHHNLLTKFPSSYFLSKRKPIDYVVISSTASKQVMETRVDDNTKIF